MIKLTLNMILPDLKYLVLNTFDDIKEKHFLKKQELLEGKSLFDISIKNEDDIKSALKNMNIHE